MRNAHAFTFAGQHLVARPSGALYWPSARLLVVSDLHLGKSERIARRSGPLLPPYEVLDTLTRLDEDITDTDPAAVISLGDSFDDMAAVQALDPDFHAWLRRLMAGRDWTWVTGNHDPAPLGLGGHAAEGVTCEPLTFRHIATEAGRHEVSGHYHPKAALSVRGRRVSRPCFLHDGNRLILPAYGTYTGGLRSRDAALAGLMGAQARAILAGLPMVEIPMPR
ncbi:ligase-associated DNA damage response endonuclease PdeM [Jannaschia ovalis]|uniref:Ligase-associated DNA damage response endonuclease PdeM n=1 Tax=Jannaschia ovalis TaxID=3038773 RepID=A0ABY8LDG6_9RHOB|nr:ligase-associated DNA damage response endonuclease PdeM [Jannaschia sp. GRR-S6-38]WGH79342.1 ligase-associated DNA damage response endonuclease PdeM [Jannaschia sp. GRR-S6-38]